MEGKDKWMSVYLNKYLFDRVKNIKDQYGYKSINEVLVTLIELGLLRFYDDYKMKDFIEKIDKLLPTLDKFVTKLRK